MERKIRKIEPFILNLPTKKRVAAYARVSSGKEAMLHSLSAQISYYSNFIQKHRGWEYVGVYADEALTGTKDNRAEFQRLLADCRDNKIDMVITKSISRFARNTVTMLETVRELKSLSVDVYFEKENICSMSGDGELMLTILSSFAQEESLSVSENCKWRIRKGFKEGKLVNLRFMYGYNIANGKIEIDPYQAEIVKMIFADYMNGMGCTLIAKKLRQLKIPTLRGGTWKSESIANIIKNEKYAGNALLQKTYTVDFLTKEKKINKGEIPQYFVENSHPAIIQPETFDLVQHQLSKRKQGCSKRCGNNVISGKIICGDCGSVYGSKIWHSTSKYKRTIWQCNSKFKNKYKCSTPHLNEEIIKKAFVDCFNSILSNSNELIRGYETIIISLTDTTAIDKESIILNDDLKIVTELLKKCVEENAHTALNQTEYKKRYEGLAQRFTDIKTKLSALDESRIERSTKKKAIRKFINALKKQKNLLTEFDEGVWLNLLESITVFADNKLTFSFKDGLKIDWII